MLSSLHIQNYALIDDVTIEFGPGLNALTGETGAGKSIIIGALSLILGDKPDPDAIRTGKDSAVLEAVFDLTGDWRQETGDGTPPTANRQPPER